MPIGVLVWDSGTNFQLATTGMSQQDWLELL